MVTQPEQESNVLATRLEGTNPEDIARGCTNSGNREETLNALNNDYVTRRNKLKIRHYLHQQS